MFVGVRFFEGGTKFYQWNETPKIWGNYSKVFIKINKTLENYWENSGKMQIFPEIFLIFWPGIIF